MVGRGRRWSLRWHFLFLSLVDNGFVGFELLEADLGHGHVLESADEELVLAGLQEEAAETVLSVKSSGRLSRVAASDIAYISGAGDYTEIVTTTGDTLLHSATLTELEKSLPAFFLRVHRSYLVNTRQIASLERNSAGTGELRLVTKQHLPVSRRIMPKVKAALT